MRTRPTIWHRLLFGCLIFFFCVAVRAEDTRVGDSNNPAANKPYYRSFYGFTGIHAAAAQGNVTQLKEFLKADPKSISARNGPRRTPLCIAAMRAQKEAVKFLIANGADVNDRGFEELTPLADLAMYGTTNDAKAAEIAEILIAHGALVDPVDAYKATPLLHAVEWNKPLLARTLLSRGANPAKTFSGVNSGLTPLDFALRRSHLEMANLILEFKPPLENLDTEGATPLLWAVEHGKLDAARLLLEHGAKVVPGPFTMDGAGMSPQMYHFVTNNSHGFTPLHWAVIHRNKDMIALLLQFKAPVDIKDERGQTPLDMAMNADSDRKSPKCSAPRVAHLWAIKRHVGS